MSPHGTKNFFRIYFLFLQQNSDTKKPLLYSALRKECGENAKYEGKKEEKNVKRFFLVGGGGLEPPTSTLSVLRSNQLSYSPSLNLKELFVHGV